MVKNWSWHNQYHPPFQIFLEMHQSADMVVVSAKSIFFWLSLCGLHTSGIFCKASVNGENIVSRGAICQKKIHHSQFCEQIVTSAMMLIAVMLYRLTRTRKFSCIMHFVQILRYMLVAQVLQILTCYASQDGPWTHYSFHIDRTHRMFSDIYQLTQIQSDASQTMYQQFTCFFYLWALSSPFHLRTMQTRACSPRLT